MLQCDRTKLMYLAAGHDLVGGHARIEHAAADEVQGPFAYALTSYGHQHWYFIGTQLC